MKAATVPAAAASGGETQALDVNMPQAPRSLTLEEIDEWNTIAPQAFKMGTLDDSTVIALRDLCQARVLKDRLLRAVSDVGDLVPAANGNIGANPLLARFTTLLQRVEAGMARFKLAPMGQAIVVATEKPADPFSQFDDAAAGQDKPGGPIH